MSANETKPAGEGAAPPPAAAAKAGTPVIRRLDVLSEDPNERLWKKIAPAWAISGGIHVVLVAASLFIFGGSGEGKINAEDKVVTTAVEEKNEKEENLTNEDIGFDADLMAATEIEREADKNIEAPLLPDQPVDAEKSENDAPILGVTGIADTNKDAGALNLSEAGTMKQGAEGGFSSQMAKGFGQRGSGATKDLLLKKGGGNSASEAAVARGLAYLARTQNKDDGSWSFDGRDKANAGEKAAATGMALLPFLAAGITHKYAPPDAKGQKYQQVVAKGLNYLQDAVKADGKFATLGSQETYGQAIAAIALCEAVGMTRDRGKLREKAQLAIDYIQRGQGSDGGWRYKPKQVPGDTSVVGWCVQALKSAQLAELKVDVAKLNKASDFLDQAASGEYQSRYGYTDSTKSSNSLSAVGLLCRQYIPKNRWGAKTPGLINGVKEFVEKPGSLPGANQPLYYMYYATQVIHFFDGPAWHQIWNPRMRDYLIKTQDVKDEKDKNYGSWSDMGKDNHFESKVGRHGCTCLSLLCLEVYYRHLPLNKRDDSGRAELDK